MCWADKAHDPITQVKLFTTNNGHPLYVSPVTACFWKVAAQWSPYKVTDKAHKRFLVFIFLFLGLNGKLA